MALSSHAARTLPAHPIHFTYQTISSCVMHGGTWPTKLLSFTSWMTNSGTVIRKEKGQKKIHLLWAYLHFVK